MKFKRDTPKEDCLGSLKYFENFLQHGKEELSEFLKNFLNLDEVRIQVCKLNILKEWLMVNELDVAMDVPVKDNEICIVSQIQANGEVISYFPYVLKGRNVKKFLELKSFLTKLAEAISDQITLCYLQNFKGGDWIFGENLARMIVSNCISTQKYDGIKFAHLIEKMEQLATSTFEGTFFPTGVIVSSDTSKYKEHFLKFRKEKQLDQIDKRQWFLANGQESFFLLDNSTKVSGIYIKPKPQCPEFINRYFHEYYLTNELMAPDVIVRTVGPNEISVSDSDGKEFVKVENVWRYRHRKNITQFLVDQLHIDYKISYAILYYTLMCSRNHVSSIIWMPNDCSIEAIRNLTASDGIKIWTSQLSILNESHQVLVEKILASDGAVVIDKNGYILYECVFADMSKVENDVDREKLVGSGEVATRLLAKNGVAIKISQDGTIKVFAGNEKIYY